jgi:hypothetical protein
LAWGLGLAIAMQIIELMTGAMGPAASWRHIGLGAFVATHTLFAHGAVVLARQATGAVRLGLRIAAISWVVSILFNLAWQAAYGLSMVERPGWLVVMQNVWTVIALGPVIGLTIAAATRRAGVAAAGFVVTLVVHPFLIGRMWTVLHLSIDGFLRMSALFSVIRLGAILLFALTIAAGVAPPDPSLVERGLARAVGPRWLRGVAAIGLACVAIFAMRHGDGVAPACRFTVLVSLLVNAAVLVWFGLALAGTASRAVADLRRHRLAFAASLSLWCGSISIMHLLTFILSPPTKGGGYLYPLTQVLPVVSLVSFAVAIGAISKFASRRGLEKLHTAAMGSGTWIVLLLLASLGAQSWIDYTPFAPDKVDAAVGLGSAAALFVSLRLTLRLFDSVTAALAGTTSLPQARIVPP